MSRAFTASILLTCGSLGCASRPPAQEPEPEPGWSVYRNAKYGYRIAYPDGYEVRPVGPVGERDGRSIRIGLVEYAASTPAVYVELHPTTSFYELSAGKELKGMQTEVSDIEIGGTPARQIEFRWTENGELAFVEIHREGVLLRFDAPAGLREFQGTIWWKIVSTFQLRGPR